MSGPSGKRILAVDDDVELCELLAAYFEKEGFLFTHVPGRDAAGHQRQGGLPADSQ